jgi:NAD+ diphosphatase
MPFISEIESPPNKTEPSLWFVFRSNDLLVRLSDKAASIPCVIDMSELNLHPVRERFLGTNDGRLCYSAEVPADTEPPAGMSFRGLRALFELLDEELFWIAGRALHILGWERTHRYCSRCSTPFEMKSDELAKSCPVCGLIDYPRISPAVIVAVIRDHEILLAHAHHFPEGYYSVIAGFVEAGETLEGCIRREIREEVGIEVENIRYFGSLPWPFPNSLMIAFTSDYGSGTISIDGNEIADAGWYRADNLPKIPGRVSIARRLIDWFVENHT